MLYQLFDQKVQDFNTYDIDQITNVTIENPLKASINNKSMTANWAARKNRMES